jgi:ATP-binding cassette subfamily F protein 1
MNFSVKSVSFDSDISIKELSLSISNKILLDNCDVILSQGENYGIVGNNGCGKSTFLKLIASGLKICEKKKIYMVEQETAESENTVLEDLLLSNNDLQTFKKREHELQQLLQIEEDQGNFKEYEQELEYLYEWSTSIEIENIEAEASKILFGLGFNYNMQRRKTNTYSGGWRMRISIAKGLLNKPELLILDEPTNHLDLNAVIWLGNYLQEWNTKGRNKNKTLLLVSHDQDFLDTISTRILRFSKQNILMYRGNYSKMLEMVEQERRVELKEWDKKKKDLKSKKELKNNRPQKIYEQQFSFSSYEDVSNKKGGVFIDNLTFAYNSIETTIFENLSIGVHIGEKKVIVGNNGSGKSTLLKILSNEITIPAENLKHDARIKVGKYNQHFEDSLPMDKTPVEYLQTIFIYDSIETIRKRLSNFNLESKAHNTKIADCSGGQKSRICFSVLSDCDILLLDEPTNHLDMETIQGLSDALINFPGGIILVSHDAKLIQDLDCQLWVCNNKTITRYDGDFEDYREELIDNFTNTD